MVTAQSNAEAVATYKELLTTEWTRALPHKVLALQWQTLEWAPAEEETGPLTRLLDPNRRDPFPVEYFRSIVTRIRDGTRFVRIADLPEMPADYAPPRKPPEAVWQAARLATYLTLRAHAAVAGDTAFFADVQALAFQAAIHFVLPELRKKYPDAHALLVNASVLFVIGYAAEDPAQYAYMMSMVHGYLGDEDQRLRSLYASFRFTPPQDHSYLTKAQEYWSELLDLNRSDEAERFLLSLHWWSLPAQQDEVREMVVAAFKYILDARHSRQ